MDRLVVSPQTTDFALSGPPGYDFLGALSRRKGILIVFIVASAALGYLKYAQQPRVYSTSLRLVITTQNPPHLVGGDQHEPPVLSRKHINLLRSEVVLAKACEESQITKLDSLRNENDPVLKLKGMVVARPIDAGVDTIELSATGTEPLDLPHILESVVMAFQDILSEDSHALSKSSAELVEKLQKQLSEEKSHAEERYSAIVNRLAISPDPISGRLTNPYLGKVSELQQQRSQRDREYRQVVETIARINDILNTEGSEAAGLMQALAVEASRHLSLRPQAPVTDENSKAQLIPALSQRILVLESELHELRLRAQRTSKSVGVNHPTLASLNNEIAARKSLLTSLIDQRKGIESTTTTKTSQADTALSGLSSFEQEVIAIYQATQRREADRLRSLLRTYENEIAVYQEKATGVEGDIQELNLLSTQIKEKDSQIKDIVDRLSGLALLANNYTSTKVRVIDSPSPASLVAPLLHRVMLQFISIGGAFAAAVVLLLDRSDLSYRCPQQIRDVLGLTVIGRIAKIPPQRTRKAGGSCRLVAIDNPNSQLTEAYRSCKATLAHYVAKQGTNCFLVTSPSAGDGKSTTALNLAACFAQSGMRTVVIDADLRRPRCHSYLGLELSPGLKNLVKKDIQPNDLVRASSVQSNLSVVTAGHAAINPSEFLETEDFAEFIGQLKAEFDIVLIDSPPVLPVADALAIAGHCDGVLMVMKIRKGVILSSHKAAEALRSVSANIVGVIVNQVERVSHYYDYGTYQYRHEGYRYYPRGYGDSELSASNTVASENADAA